MPIYEYQCTKCGHQLEVFQKVGEALLVDCPNCHQATLTKLISAAGFQLKGTGWYATDYKNNKKSHPHADSENSERDTGEKATESEKGGKESQGAESSSSSSSSTDTGGDST